MPGTITALQEKPNGRVIVVIDEVPAFTLTPVVVAQAHLGTGMLLADEDIAQLRREDTYQRALQIAYRFLGYRARSEAELRKRLTRPAGRATGRPGAFDEQVVGKVVGRLTELGFLDDAAFAQMWIDNRDRLSPRGTIVLRIELRQKGIAQDIVEGVVGERKDDEDVVYALAQKHLHTLRQADRPTFYRRLGNYLLSRGFSYAVVKPVVSRLWRETQESAPAEDAGAE